ncbi:hypothetical protein ACQKP8_26980, partial [Photobacterium alginatilyticum]|uniref:hypothetical protein n=1 Tax=Photobacterium alginatilyticum TaxID=1775171 RepID=UPI004067B52D
LHSAVLVWSSMCFVGSVWGTLLQALCTLEPSSSMVECSSHISAISLAIRSAKGCLKFREQQVVVFFVAFYPGNSAMSFHRYFALKG